MKASYRKHILHFKTAAKTSRDTLHERPVWILELEHDGGIAYGECAPLFGLSVEQPEEIESQLDYLCSCINFGRHPQALLETLSPSVRFALEMALKDTESTEDNVLFPSAFTKEEAGIPINGLIWMGNYDYMLSQIQTKLDSGFRCLKLKIGGIAFDKEKELLKIIRSHFPENKLELRLDANGAFSVDNALDKLKDLSEFQIHSIEQPIKANQWNAMAKVVKSSPIPIALDEELIGVALEKAEKLLETIQPWAVILKPSLLGGFKASEQWLEAAEKQNIIWWATSALESNIGLNAIAQWCFVKGQKIVHGLGTGQLFTDNFERPIYLKGDQMWFNKVNDHFEGRRNEENGVFLQRQNN